MRASRRERQGGQARGRAGWAAVRATLRFVKRDGTYHAAALTYYAILSVFPAGALAFALLGVLGAESVIDDVVNALDRRAVRASSSMP